MTDAEREEALDKLVDELNDATRDLRRVRERVCALIDRERELRERVTARERTA